VSCEGRQKEKDSPVSAWQKLRRQLELPLAKNGISDQIENAPSNENEDNKNSQEVS
jgi:hypothetical protein